ncbi:MAG: hypothetical protein M1398_06540 [Deltaproteobacteria bacterium]|nr:hypothetical protein [Deltaproteobacteria bacterium]MDA8307871.1 hypothetical protein [Deltaproteobacteria bacterium]
MGPAMQWLSLTGGVVIFLYGLFRLDWIPLILGILIVAFSISKMMRSKAEKGQSKGKDGP